MSCVASLRDTTVAPRSRDRSESAVWRLELGTLSWKSAPASLLPVEVTFELATIPLTAATTSNTCWETSSIRPAGADSCSCADCTTWRLPPGTGPGAVAPYELVLELEAAVAGTCADFAGAEPALAADEDADSDADE